MTDPELGDTFFGSMYSSTCSMPGAAEHVEVVRELVLRVGIEGCCGASAGVQALGLEAMEEKLDIMAVLMDAGVIDLGSRRGIALASASEG